MNSKIIKSIFTLHTLTYYTQKNFNYYSVNPLVKTIQKSAENFLRYARSHKKGTSILYKP